MTHGGRRIVVVDTNFIGRGGFKAEALRQLASRLSRRGHALVIPEVVIWEWAQHAHDAIAEARVATKKAADAVDDSLDIELPTVVQTSVDSVVNRIRAVVSSFDDVEVVDTAPGDAVSAIAQQVMQTGTGTRGKEGTKTGAADALVLHVVERQLKSFDEVVLATGDKRLGEAAGKLDGRVVVVPDHRSLWLWHGLTPPRTTDLISAVGGFIEQQAAEALTEGWSFPLFEAGERVDSDIFEHAGFTTDDVRQTDVTVEGIEAVQVTDVEIVVGDEVPRLVLAEVTATAVAMIVNWFIGGSDGELLDEWATVDVEIVVPVTVELDEEWQPFGFDVNNAAEVLLRPTQ